MDKLEISKLRETPLEAVLERFGAQPDPQDPKRNWKSHAGRITVTDGKFYNHDQEHGGGGAIDLAMHLGGFRFKEAVAWLGGNISRDAAITQYQAESRKHAERILDNTPAPKLGIPEPVASKLDRVRGYLTHKRDLPESIVENAIEKGRLWADKYANAVFSLRDLEGKQIGAELRGTSDKPFHGVRGEKGLFFTGTSKPKTAVFVESAIDAMSYQAMHPNTLVIGTAGSGRDVMTAAARALDEKGFKIIAGFDADKPGDAQAKALAAAVQSPVERQRPSHGKDWNEQLRAQRSTARAADEIER
ncbi:hypothetical protein FEP54_05609 [Burkholderia multivorans]|uniref:DUF3991 and TOPRIM domain-containing protein n=2 Tax=Burkholderia multivorans TaxID=87883 RepID=UPI002862937C|nr:DUF3991 and TOPRIM domain-containing protein [Burkholderia multivorans]MDR8920774.1 hypothetical protein [Burkholderia multivorans]MDR8926855.1 hypothetical protein [Burkholderia multivorans]MDR8993298.1 hypothetical protein [Burkholderia multivorans]MDR9024171.1 hypothetical protein [Burkholderia multivorans]MDR9030407.1 hypothetical protein [Burkholderia multivorans]